MLKIVKKSGVCKDFGVKKAPPNLPKGEEPPLSLPLGELSGRAESRPYGVVCSVFDSAQTDKKNHLTEKLRFGRKALM